MRKIVDFNVNHWVSVKLTDAGRSELTRQRQEFEAEVGRKFSAPIFTEDENGWSSWQAHFLFSSLGHMLRPGGEMPFDTNIKIEVVK